MTRIFFIIAVLALGIASLQGTTSRADEAGASEHERDSGSAARPVPAVAHLPPGPMGEPGSGSWPPLGRVAPGVFEMGGVRIVKSEHEVVFPAVVNMDRGLIEYLVVGAAGKVHESLLRTEVEPYCLHIAMLLVGLEGASHPLSVQGEARTPEGDPVDIRVEWKDGSTVRGARIEDWVVNKSEGGSLKPMHWVFTGSFISGGMFMAQMEKSIVAVFHDPAALIDNPLPEGYSDEVWFVNEGVVPATGTAVTVTISRTPVR